MESKERMTDAAGPDAESSSVMKLVPGEIKLDILSRLPFDSVLDCKLVCKSWCKTVENPSFAKIHLRQQLDSGHSDDKVSFLFLTLENRSRLYYGNYDENREPRMNLKTVNHPLIKKRLGEFAMVGSCNGLVCFSITYANTSYDPIYICNPSVGEQITLPRLTVMARRNNNVEFEKTTNFDVDIVSGFGYNSITDEYKVVRIYYDLRIPQPQGQVQVYTLGSGRGWRNIGLCHFSLPYVKPSVLVCGRELSFLSRGILANDALHWLDDDWNIVSFDLVNEKFSLLPSPPCFCPGQENFYVLQLLGECLCVVNNKDGACLDIWSFKRQTTQWENMFSIPCESDRFIDVCWPISLTSKGELILRFNYKTLYNYVPQSTEMYFLMNCNTASLSTPLPYPLIEVIPHNNSFVSLKALGESSVNYDSISN